MTRLPDPLFEACFASRISLGPRPWLHPLLRWLASFARGLHSYYCGKFWGQIAQRLSEMQFKSKSNGEKFGWDLHEATMLTIGRISIEKWGYHEPFLFSMSDHARIDRVICEAFGTIINVSRNYQPITAILYATRMTTVDRVIQADRV